MLKSSGDESFWLPSLTPVNKGEQEPNEKLITQTQGSQGYRKAWCGMQTGKMKLNELSFAKLYKRPENTAVHSWILAKSPVHCNRLPLPATYYSILKAFCQSLQSLKFIGTHNLM